MTVKLLTRISVAKAFLRLNPQPPEEAILDLNATDHPIYGQQAKRFMIKSACATLPVCDLCPYFYGLRSESGAVWRPKTDHVYEGREGNPYGLTHRRHGSFLVAKRPSFCRHLPDDARGKVLRGESGLHRQPKHLTTVLLSQISYLHLAAGGSSLDKPSVSTRLTG